MKPLIGICTNQSSNDSIGTITKLGLTGQDWQLLASDYVRAVERAGGCPVIIPIVEDIDTISRLIENIDGIIFTGGSDLDPKLYGELPKNGLGSVNPIRDKHEMQLCREILFEASIPVLGICRGLQLINVAAGGSLYQDLEEEKVQSFNHTLFNYPKYHPTHQVSIEKGSRLYDIFETEKMMVNSFNHQAVKKVGEGIFASMKAEDGVVEGIEIMGDRFVAAVQWHPEMMIEKHEEYLILFKKFIDECK